MHETTVFIMPDTAERVASSGYSFAGSVELVPNDPVKPVGFLGAGCGDHVADIFDAIETPEKVNEALIDDYVARMGYSYKALDSGL